MSALSPEDAKLVTLARATRARTGAAEAAAVRDADGRTYAGASLATTVWQLSALQVCLGMAASSGVKRLESVVLMTAGDPTTAVSAPDLAALRDVGGAEVPVLVVDASGTVCGTRST